MAPSSQKKEGGPPNLVGLALVAILEEEARSSPKEDLLSLDGVSQEKGRPIHIVSLAPFWRASPEPQEARAPHPTDGGCYPTILLIHNLAQ